MPLTANVLDGFIRVHMKFAAKSNISRSIVAAVAKIHSP